MVHVLTAMNGSIMVGHAVQNSSAVNIIIKHDNKQKKLIPQPRACSIQRKLCQCMHAQTCIRCVSLQVEMSCNHTDKLACRKLCVGVAEYATAACLLVLFVGSSVCFEQAHPQRPQRLVRQTSSRPPGLPPGYSVLRLVYKPLRTRHSSARPA